MTTQRLDLAEGIVPKRKVEMWHATADRTCNTDGTPGIIASFFDGLIAYLQGTLHNISDGDCERNVHQLLERCSATLLFWGFDHGVSQGKVDESLQHSTLLRDTVLVVLISIGELLSRGKIRMDSPMYFLRSRFVVKEVDESGYANLAVEEGDEPGHANLAMPDPEEACRILQSKIECLIALNASIECPAESDSDDEEQIRSHTIAQDVPGYRYFSDLIAAKFPSAEAQLVERLGRANWSRYNHLQQQRDNLQTELEPINEDKAGSEFQDSGLGSNPSVMLLDPTKTQSTYAASVVSSRAEASHKRLPSLPKDARDGKPFTCEVCNQTISIRRMKNWREHVFKDICAYTCIFSECESVGVLFEDLSTISAHVSANHWKHSGMLDIACPLCASRVTGSLDLGMLHLARHMEEIALGVLPHGEEALEDDSMSSSASELSDAETFLHATFTCQTCGNAYAAQADLKAHISRDHGYRNPEPNGMSNANDNLSLGQRDSLGHSVDRLDRLHEPIKDQTVFKTRPADIGNTEQVNVAYVGNSGRLAGDHAYPSLSSAGPSSFMATEGSFELDQPVLQMLVQNDPQLYADPNTSFNLLNLGGERPKRSIETARLIPRQQSSPPDWLMSHGLTEPDAWASPQFQTGSAPAASRSVPYKSDPPAELLKDTFLRPDQLRSLTGGVAGDLCERRLLVDTSHQSKVAFAYALCKKKRRREKKTSTKGKFITGGTLFYLLLCLHSTLRLQH
ncbi:hypothetical protein E8E13_010081 [Curvularia kusanoi]|uniref:C2H2-type domain-containing protein n=1 Tax=Curvularia kusanoi TaxID=90978 RepID=A0A9P4TEB1_CURKU|nr:hypothetical protein E8E13_010081 [Curvularia kusanoi]